MRRYVEDIRIELENVLKQEGNSIHWWVLLNKAMLVVYVRKHRMDIKLPLPTILGSSKWRDEWKYKERDEAEIERVRAIWSKLVHQIREKLEKVDNGVSTIEEEFKEGILFEDGQWGLKYERSWEF